MLLLAWFAVTAGDIPEDRVVNQFAVGGLYMTFIHINRMLQQYGCQNFPFSNHADVGLVRTMVDLFGGIGYRFSDRISTTLGYRWLKLDYDHDDFLYDVRQEGVAAGLTFRF